MKPRKKPTFRTTDKSWKIVDDPELSTKFSQRVVVVDAETEEVLDNANGYGYNRYYNAERGYEFKNSTPDDRARWHLAKNAASGWVHGYHRLVDEWYALRRVAWDRDDRVPSDDEFAELMRKHDKKVKFTAADLARYL